MAITTTYNGIEYRSRLEARWASFMQNIGWDFVYEPFDGDGYIPDFLVQGDRPFLVEVKPAVTRKEYEAAIPKAEQGLRHHWQHDILIVGASQIMSQAGAMLHAGLIGWGVTSCCDSNCTVPHHHFEGTEWEWSTADWLHCSRCRSTGVRSTDMDWTCQPCGHDHKTTRFAAGQYLRSMWADACNDVKWRGTPA